MKITSRFTGLIIFESDHKTIKETVLAAIKAEVNLSGADLSRADLSRADLSRADLFGVDLSGVDLSGADLSRADLSRADLSRACGIISMQFFGFNIYVQKDNIKIGCEYMTVSNWRNVTVDEAVKMGIKKKHYESYKILCEAAISVL